jgi:hypothetical protein
LEAAAIGLFPKFPQPAAHKAKPAPKVAFPLIEPKILHPQPISVFDLLGSGWPPPIPVEGAEPDPWPQGNGPPPTPGVPPDWQMLYDGMLSWWRWLNRGRAENGYAPSPVPDVTVYFDAETWQEYISAFVDAWNELADAGQSLVPTLDPGLINLDTAGIADYAAWAETLRVAPLFPVGSYHLSIALDGTEVASGDVTNATDTQNPPISDLSEWDGAAWVISPLVPGWAFSYEFDDEHAIGNLMVVELGDQDGDTGCTCLIAFTATDYRVNYAIDAALAYVDVTRATGVHTLTITATRL